MSERTHDIDDIDQIIAAKLALDRAFWHALGAKYQGGVSANEIARRVHAAGIASRPTTLAHLKPYASPARRASEALQSMQESARDAAAAMTRMVEALQR